MRFKKYPDEDAVYVQMREGKIVKGKDLDDARHLDFGENGELLGIEFLYVSDGVDLDDIPQINEVEVAELLGDNNIKMLA